MNIDKPLQIFSALSQETRLKAFKILIEYGQTGVAAGVISDRLGIPHNTLSFHLSHLFQSGLVLSLKEGRSVIYTANFETIEKTICFLSENCCIKEHSDGKETKKECF